jgi:hypothetical protein
MIVVAGHTSYLKKRALCMDIYPVRVRLKPRPVYIKRKRGELTDNFYYGNSNIPAVNEMLGTDNTEDYLSSLPKEIQQEVLQHTGEFHSAQEMQEYAEGLMKRL